MTQSPQATCDAESLRSSAASSAPPARLPLLVLRENLASPSWNMAVDEALLLSTRELEQPILRFYGWSQPAATFGYFQKYAEVAATTLLRPLIRRPTGGGIVPHDRDWTYSLAFPPGHPWYELRAIESYRMAHSWIVDSFRRLGISTELAPCCRRTQPGQCFSGYERFDVLWGGRKIAGAAQRRNRDGLLIQGSVQPPPGLPRDTWHQAMLDSTPVGWTGTPSPGPVPASVQERAAALDAAKYSQPSYLESR